MKKEKLGFTEKLRAYRLMNNFIVLIMLFVVMIISILIYIIPAVRSSEIWSNISLAFSTSLLASIFCLISDIYIKYKDYENERFLGDIQSFGIRSLHFNKQQILSELINECDRELWISGYRLILTANITAEIEGAMSRGASVKVLLCPPWMEGYRLMYGKSERIIENYCKVFNTLRKCMKNYGNSCEVHFTEKPLLSDTYKVDQHIIAGPYMHNEDTEHGKITAKDFFTYDLIKKSRLNMMLSDEYTTLFENAEYCLDWEAYDKECYDIFHGDYRESERVEKMKRLCVPYNK